MWEGVTKFRKVASCAFAWYFCNGFVFFRLGKAPQREPFKPTILNPTPRGSVLQRLICQDSFYRLNCVWKVPILDPKAKNSHSFSREARPSSEHKGPQKRTHPKSSKPGTLKANAKTQEGPKCAAAQALKAIETTGSTSVKAIP